MANLAQITTFKICAPNFFKTSARTSIIVFLTNSAFKKANLAQIITFKLANLGPDNNFTAYIYIYMYVYVYMYAVELFSGSLFALVCVQNWSILCFFVVSVF